MRNLKGEITKPGSDDIDPPCSSVAGKDVEWRRGYITLIFLKKTSLPSLACRNLGKKLRWRGRPPESFIYCLATVAVETRRRVYGLRSKAVSGFHLSHGF